jgi:Arm DNA-binding domain
MTVKLTDRFLTSRKAPQTGRAIYTDASVPGLAFRVSAGTTFNAEGRRDWLLRYRPRRQAQKAVALGTYPALSLAQARHDCQHRLFERDRDIPSQGRASQRRAADAGDRGNVDVAGFLIRRFEEFLHALIFVDIGRAGRVDEEQGPLRVAQCIEIDDPRGRLFAPGLHRRVLLGQRDAQRRHVVEDEIERGVEEPAGAYRRLDEPFWKLEGCELGFRSVAIRTRRLSYAD